MQEHVPFSLNHGSACCAKIGRPVERAMMLGGLAALACYTIHATFHLAHGRWYDLFWTCHIAAVLVGVGLLARNAAINGVGVLLGLMGLPLWVSDWAGGGEFHPSSLLTHVGALAIGLCGVARLGMPRGTWWKAAATLIGMIALCRLATPAEANVNVAFKIPTGREDDFASHTGYLVWIISAATAVFIAADYLMRRLVELVGAWERRNGR